MNAKTLLRSKGLIEPFEPVIIPTVVRKRVLTNYARHLVWKSEGAVSYTLRPCSKSDSKRDHKTRSQRKRK